MSTPKLSAALLQQAVDAVAKYDGNQVAAAKALGIVRSTFQGRLREALRLGVKPGDRLPDPDDVQALKAKVKRLEVELHAHQKVDDQTEIIKGVIGNMARQVEELNPPAFIVKPSSLHSRPGVPTLFVSDLHWGEVVQPAQINGVNEYNISIARRRMQVLAGSTAHLLRIISPKLDYPGIVIPLGGDMISGNIHDELT